LIKAIIFDFGGVISQTLFETHSLSEQALGLPPGSLDWLGPFAPSNKPDLLWQAMQNSEITERDYWLERSRQVGALLHEEWPEMQTLVRRTRANNPDQVTRPEILELVAWAKSNLLRLAICSNELDLFYGPQLRQMLSILSNFECIVDATYTGILKPNPQAYALVLTELSLTASECLFIDDQIKNIQGAIAVGLRTIHFDVQNPELSCRLARQLIEFENGPIGIKTK
jgi:putative hydrolase of the HAD superfamily